MCETISSKELKQGFISGIIFKYGSKIIDFTNIASGMEHTIGRDEDKAMA